MDGCWARVAGSEWRSLSGRWRRYRLSLGDRKDDHKYYKDDAAWDYAEDVLRQVLKQRNADYFEAANEAAFYGPKIDVQVKNVIGREETASTNQVDPMAAQEDRFDMTFTGQDGQQHRPWVLHRAPLGTHERFIAFLIEHFAGTFPLWMAPVQVRVLPVGESHLEGANAIVDPSLLEPMSPRPRRVLVIDDNVDAAESLQLALETEGHEVGVAHDGPGGLERARALAPDVVLCDVGLPGMDGYAVAKALRGEPGLRDSYLVALTGYALPEDLRRATDAGFDAHLTKPASIEGVEEVVARARPPAARGSSPGDLPSSS